MNMSEGEKMHQFGKGRVFSNLGKKARPDQIWQDPSMCGLGEGPSPSGLLSQWKVWPQGKMDTVANRL